MDKALLASVTVIVPFYRNVGMLRRQVEEWAQYPRFDVRVIVVDDGSPEPALPVLEAAGVNGDGWGGPLVRLYRITVDIPWNREGARNLGVTECTTEWFINVDIDHVLPAAVVRPLLDLEVDGDCWYRFRRFRCGRADETRKKDAIPDDCKFGEIKPHIDSYLMRRATFLKLGGYDEDFAGMLGGGTEFLRRAEAGAKLKQLPAEVFLHVYTRDLIPDASDWSLSRDRAAGKELARHKTRLHGKRRPGLRFPWVRQL